AGCDQDRTFDVAGHPAEIEELTGKLRLERDAPGKKGALVQVPDAAVTDGRDKAIVEGDATGDERRPPSVGQDGYAASIDIVPFDEIVHDVSNGHFEVGTADELVELRFNSGAEQIHCKQRHPALAGVARNLVEVLFLSLTGLSDADDRRRRPTS